MQLTEPLTPSGPPGTETATAVSAEGDAIGFRARVVLKDGTSVCMRTIRPDDKETLRIGFERLSPRSVYQRLFQPMKELTPGDLSRLTELDYRDHFGLVLMIEERTRERMLAVGRFVREPDNEARAEIGTQDRKVVRVGCKAVSMPLSRRVGTSI